MPPRPEPKRILLKVSGEAMMGTQTFGIDDKAVSHFAAEIAGVARTGTEIAVVIGGGNIFRGLAIAAKGGDRVTGDHMGMLATVMNALALEAALVREGLDARALSAIEMPSICETYVHRRAAWHMSRKVIVVLAGGTGNPFFTTDSGAALRALELECDALAEGNAGRRRLFGRSAPRPACHALRARHLPGSDLARPGRHGHGCLCACPR